MKMKITEIIVLEGRRPVDHEAVAQLVESIKELGLINPITVDTSNTLIAGNHRLEAHKLLGLDEIEVNVVDFIGLSAELAEIDENLMRSALNHIDRGNALKRRKEIYEELHPETKAGVAGGKASSAKKSTNEKISFVQTPSFAADTAAKIGVSARSVQMDIKRVSDLSDATQEIVKSHKIKQADATKLAKIEDKDEQVKVAGIMAAAIDAKEKIDFSQAVKTVKGEDPVAEPAQKQSSVYEQTLAAITGFIGKRVTNLKVNKQDQLVKVKPF